MLTAVARASLRRLSPGRPLGLFRATALPTGRSPVDRTASAGINSRSSQNARGHAALFSTSQSVREPEKRTTTTRKASPKKKSTTAAAKKKKPAAKKAKKPKAKPKPKKVKKVLSPEAKAKAQKTALRKTALLGAEPKGQPDTAWSVYVTRHLKGEKMAFGETADRMRQLSSSFKSLTGSELESLQSSAASNKLANNAAYKAWVESHPAEDIHAANLARAKLRRSGDGGARRRTAVIKDNRQPKQSSSSFIFYAKSRWGSGDFTGRPVGEALKSIAADWKALAEEAKQPFEDLAKADRERYEKEKKSVLNLPVRKKPPTS